MSTRNDGLSPQPLGRRAGLLMVAALVVGVALADGLLARQFSLGALYMVPFIIATQYVRRGSRLLLLAALLIALNFVSLIVVHYLKLTPAHEFRYRLINRAFVAVAIGGSAALIVGYIRIRDYWLRRQAEMAPSNEEVSFLLQVFQLFEDVVAAVLAGGITAVVLVLDYVKPQTMNVPILYCIPLALLAMTRSRWLLWGGVSVLMGLAYIGFHWGMRIEVTPETHRLLVINRQIACAALLSAAVLFHFTSSPAGRGKGGAAGA